MKSREHYMSLASILVALIFFMLPNNSLCFQNEPDGFRGIKWGNNIKDLKGMGIAADDGDSKYYIRKNDKLKIGDAVLESITYGFYKNRFHFVLIEFKAGTNYMKIKETLFEQYGAGNQNNEFLEQYTWYGSNVDILLKYSKISKEGRISYFYKPLTDEQTKDRKEKSIKGTGDL